MNTVTVMGPESMHGPGSTFTHLPATTIGRVAATLTLVSLVALAAFVPILQYLQASMGGTVLLGWVAQIAAVLMILTGGAASLLGIFALTRYSEHSWAVVLSLAPAVSFVVIMVVEMYTVLAHVE